MNLRWGLATLAGALPMNVHECQAKPVVGAMKAPELQGPSGEHDARAAMDSGCVCPPEAGAAWRAAAEAGVDMSLLQDSLRLTPWQRLRENERALALALALEAAGEQLRERSALDS